MNNPCYSCQLAGDQVHAYQRVRARGFSRSSPALIARCKRRLPWRNIVGQRFSRNRGRRDGSRRVARETQMPRACSHAAPVTRSAGVGFFFSADPATVPCNILIAGTRKRYASRRLHARPLAFLASPNRTPIGLTLPAPRIKLPLVKMLHQTKPFISQLETCSNSARLSFSNKFKIKLVMHVAINFYTFSDSFLSLSLRVFRSCRIPKKSAPLPTFY